MQNRFRVGAGAEAMATRFQFGAQFLVIVDFAIEDDDGIAGIREDMGWSPERKIDDFQAGGAQRNQLRFEDALLVGPAMNNRGDGALNPARGRETRIYA